MAWKYIIVRTGNREVPVIFPEDIIHACMDELMRQYFVSIAQVSSGSALSPAALDKLAADIKTVAAGGLMLQVIVERDSKSETLQVGSRAGDTAAINSHPYTHGFVDEEEPDGDVR